MKSTACEDHARQSSWYSIPPPLPQFPPHHHTSLLTETRSTSTTTHTSSCSKSPTPSSNYQATTSSPTRKNSPASAPDSLNVSPRPRAQASPKTTTMRPRPQTTGTCTIASHNGGDLILKRSCIRLSRPMSRVQRNARKCILFNCRKRVWLPKSECRVPGADVSGRDVVCSEEYETPRCTVI
jgi:hypothetical protein